MSNSSALKGFVKARQWDNVLHAIQQNPDELDLEFLQEICRGGPSLEVIDHIYQTRYQLLRDKTAGNSQCVLHVLCYFGAPMDVITFIVSHYAETLKKKDDSRRTPLDYAMSIPWIHAKEEQKTVISYLQQQWNPSPFDGLTGLPNKSALKWWGHMPPPGIKRCSMLGVFIDLAGFKAINDKINDEAGDEALKYFASNMEKCCLASADRRSEIATAEVYRPGGDEFFILVKLSAEASKEVEKSCKIVYEDLCLKLSNITFEKEGVSSFCRLGCCYMRSVSGGDDIGKINYYAEGLQAQVKTNIGMARGESKTLNVIRSEHKSNISELTELNPNTIAKLDATSQERIAKNSSLILIQQFTLPNARYHLVGREDERKQLQEKVQSGTITALLGMAGSGKSALAKKFAREWDEERSGDTHRAAIWLSADTEDNLRRNFDILLQKLKVEPRPQDKGNKIPTKEKAQRIWEKLGQIPNLDWLVVFDNVPEAIDDKEGPAVLHDWFFPCTLGRGGRILLTSRSASYSGNTVIGEIAAINVDVLKTDDAVKLLLRDAPNNKNVDDESSAAKELVVDYLDHLPLAIVTVAAQIVDTKPAATVSGYLKEIKQKRADGGMNSVLEVLRGTLTYARNKGMGYELDIAANVNPDKISVKLFRDTDSARRLCKLNLLQLVEDGMYSMHRLLQKAARQDSSPEKAIDAVWSALASYNTNVSVTWTVGTEMLPHIQFLRTIFFEETDLSTLQEQTVITYGYCLGTGGDIYSASLGDFSSGRAAYEMALKVFHQAYGEGANNLDIANLLNSLGLSCMAFSRYEDARKHLEDSLRMKRSGYGAGIENNDIIRMLANLGSLHLQVGEYDKALTVLEESRDMHYSLHGKHVTSGAILRTLCLLGNLNMQLSQRTKAQKIFGDCLEMSRDIHGELHENILVAGALNALGVIHHFNRKFEDALECFEKSLDIKLHVYSGGANNADIAGTLNDLGLFYKARGNYEKAEMTLDKALIMTRHIFGKKAPNALIAKILGNLGNLYRTIGKYEKAHTMQKDALAMKRAIYDVNHDDIAMTLNNLGNLQRELGNHKEALPILKEALAMYHHCYGKDFESADIARTLDNLGLSHMALENYEEARTMLEKSLKMKRACTGGYYEMDAKTPSIAIGLHSLGCLYTVTGKHKEASTKLQESLAMMHAVYGEEVKNVEIANVLDSLGDLDKACGNYRGAQTMFEKSLAMYCHVYYQYTQHPKIDDKVKKLEELEELCARHHSHWFFHL